MEGDEDGWEGEQGSRRKCGDAALHTREREFKTKKHQIYLTNRNILGMFLKQLNANFQLQTTMNFNPNQELEEDGVFHSKTFLAAGKSKKNLDALMVSWLAAFSSLITALSLPAWVSSRYPSLLPQSRDAKLTVGERPCGPPWWDGGLLGVYPASRPVTAGIRRKQVQKKNWLMDGISHGPECTVGGAKSFGRDTNFVLYSFL